VGILVTHPPDQSLGTTKRLSGLAEGLRARGVELTLFSPYPIRPRWWTSGSFVHVARGPGGGRIIGFVRLLEAIAYYRWSWARRLAFRNPGALRSGILQLSRDLVSAIRRHNIDILQAEQQVAAAAACLVGRSLKIPVIADIHNLWSAELLEEGAGRTGNNFVETVRDVERFIAREADGIFVPRDELKEYFVDQLRRNPNSIWILPTGGRRLSSYPALNPLPYRIIYAGSVSRWSLLKPVVIACSLMRRRGLQVILMVTKKGEMLASLRKYAKDFGITLDMFWCADPNDYYKLLASCHVGIVAWNDSLSRSMGTPGKLFDYLSVGLPVIAIGSGGWLDIVKRFNIGVVARKEPREIADELYNLLTNESRRLQLGSNALALVEGQFSWDSIAMEALKGFATVKR